MSKTQELEIQGLKEQLDSAINDIACYEAMREGFTVRASRMEAEIALLRSQLDQVVLKEQFNQADKIWVPSQDTGKCSIEGCSKTAIRLASGRCPEHKKPAMYCIEHSEQVLEEHSPEYVSKCPNCNCYFGVG